MTNPGRAPDPKPGEVWYINDLWENDAEFRVCNESECLHFEKCSFRLKNRGEFKGCACVPYKPRPSIVLGPVDDCAGHMSYYFVARLSSKSGKRRTHLGAIPGLTGDSFLYREVPRPVRTNFFNPRRVAPPNHALRSGVLKLLGRFAHESPKSVEPSDGGSYELKLSQEAPAEGDLQ